MINVSDKNQVELIGTVGTFTASSKYLAVMTLRTVETTKGANNEVGIEITWHRVVVSGFADIKAMNEARAGGFGLRARVTGRLRACHYIKADQSAVDTYEIVASSVEAIDIPGKK